MASREDSLAVFFLLTLVFIRPCSLEEENEIENVNENIEPASEKPASSDVVDEVENNTPETNTDSSPLAYVVQNPTKQFSEIKQLSEKNSFGNPGLPVEGPKSANILIDLSKPTGDTRVPKNLTYDSIQKASESFMLFVHIPHKLQG